MSFFNTPPNGGSHNPIFSPTSHGSISLQREFLSPSELSSMTGISTKTLEKWRRTGEGPEFIRLSYRKVLYRVEVFLAWIKIRERKSTSDTQGGA